MEEDEDLMEDLMLACIDCGNSFEFTAGEQKFYSDKGMTQPKRCKTCRTKKKLAREQQQSQGQGY